MKVSYPHLLLTLFLFFTFFGYSEGTKEILLTESGHGKLEVYQAFSPFAMYNSSGVSSVPDYRLYIHIETIGEKIYYGFGDPLNGENTVKTDVVYRIKDPSGNIVVGGAAGTMIPPTGAGHINSLLEAQAGPSAIVAGGYSELSYTPTVTGDYFIDFFYIVGSGGNDRRKFKYFDVTVANSSDQAKPGRLWSKAWQFTADANNLPFEGTFYILSSDGIVTSVNSNGMAPFVFTIACNQYGCFNTNNFANDRRSVSGNHIIPQYKIFLNDPDPVVYPTGVLGEVIPPIIVTADCEGTADISLTVNKEGNVTILLDINPTPGIQAEDRELSSTVVAALPNIISWDGLNGLGQPVPNNTTFNIIVTYINGLTNLPIYDIDLNPNGFIIDLKRPSGPVPTVFWDDLLVGGNANTISGCIYTPPTTGCHSINNPNVGNNNTINTYWYAVTSAPYTVNYHHKRIPGNLGPISGLTPVCPTAGNQTYTVSADPNVSEYQWTWPTGVTPVSSPPYTNSITLNFTNATNSGNITITGWNADCGNGPTSTLPVSVITVPDLTTGLTFGTCSGVAFSIPLTSSPPGASFSWTTPAPTCSANISACPPGTTGTALTGNLSVTNLSQGTVTYHVTPISSGCNGVTKNLVVTVDPKPNITSPSSPSEALCSGGTTNITLQSGLAGATINWQVLSGGCTNIVTCPGSGSTSPIANQLTLASNSSPGSVVYTITPNVGGCFGDAVTHTVNVLQLPPVVLAPFDNVCLNTAQFNLSGGTPIGGTYTLNNTAITTFNPATYGVGTYPIIYTYTNPANLCTASTDPQDIVVQDIITPNIYGNPSACVGVAETFTTANTGDPTSYIWNVTPDGTPVAGAHPWEKIITWSNAVPTTKNITVTYTDPNGCATTPGSLAVSVNPLPDPFLISPDLNVCNNRSYTYTTQPGMTGGYTWEVSNPTVNVLTPSGNTATVVWNAIGPAEWIRVNYVNANGCTAVAPTSYTVNVNPTPLYIVTGSGSVCAGSTSAYQLQGTERGNWSITSGGSIITPVNNVNAISVSWTSATVAAVSSINVTYTNTLGCAGSTTTGVNIQPLPITTFTSSTPSLVCQDDPTPSLYTMDAGGTPATYFWQVSPTSLAVIADPAANPASITWKLAGTTPQTAQLSVTATTSATTPQCSATSAPVTITINPKPNSQLTSCFDLVTSRSAKRFMLKGGTPLLTATPQQGEYLISPTTPALSFDGTNYWFDPSLVSVPTNFDISYKYTSARYGCPATSTPVTISVLGLNPPCGSTMTDPRDGISYRTSSSLVPGKCWMVENLRHGQSPSTVTSPQTDNCIVERNCLSSDPTCIAYGGLYQWDELIQYGITDPPAYQGVCPPGWHIPSAAEWTALIDAVVNLPGVPGDGLAGSYLKDQNLTNGFDALVNGIYYLDNLWAYTTGSVTGTMYWTSTHDASYPERVVTRGVNNINYSVANYPASRANAFPVRCVKD